MLRADPSPLDAASRTWRSVKALQRQTYMTGVSEAAAERIHDFRKNANATYSQTTPASGTTLLSIWRTMIFWGPNPGQNRLRRKIACRKDAPRGSLPCPHAGGRNRRGEAWEAWSPARAIARPRTRRAVRLSRRSRTIAAALLIARGGAPTLSLS